jgi:DNA repair exonuclease SbcCD nuclease subunit
MVKLFVTGDNHFGKKYGRYPQVKDILKESRFEAFCDMISQAEKEECELFVITGDLFDSINLVTNAEVKQVADVLADFPGSVIVLPGNHDYYTGAEKVWKTFEESLSAKDHNVTLIKEFRPYEFETKEDTVVIYPAFCQTKHSGQNNLSWIKHADIRAEGRVNIGLAHGAIQGITPDMKQEYFLMTEEELNDIPVDAWLIGHTHIPYPAGLQEETDTAGYKIFNAGTHEQTDLHNNTEGNGFVLTIEKSGSDATVLARKYVCGKIHFYDLEVEVAPDKETSLADAIREAVAGKEKNSIIRLCVHGTVKQDEYEKKEKIYQEILGEFLTYDTPADEELSEEITIEKIRSEFAETSFAAQFLEELTSHPTELQMAYTMLQDCRE